MYFSKGNRSVIAFLGVFCHSVPLSPGPLNKLEATCPGPEGCVSPLRTPFRRTSMAWILPSVCWAQTRLSRINLGKIESRSRHRCPPFSLDFKWQLLSLCAWDSNSSSETLCSVGRGQNFLASSQAGALALTSRRWYVEARCVLSGPKQPKSYVPSPTLSLSPSSGWMPTNGLISN